MSIAILGAAVAAGFGALAGAGLRVDPPAPPAPEAPAVDFRPVSHESAPAYPAWAPPALYARAEETAAVDELDAWFAQLAERMAMPVRPAAYAPPPDLPPAYEVRVAIIAPVPPTPATPPAPKAPPAPEAPTPTVHAAVAPPPPVVGPLIDRAQVFF